MTPGKTPGRGSKALTVAGMMSGTSADGIDVALVRISQGSASQGRVSPDQTGQTRNQPDAALSLHGPGLELLAHRAFPFPKALRVAVLAAMNAERTSAAELARLNWRLGMAYAEALLSTIDSTGITPDLAGCHGQTIYHQAAPATYAGRSIACTWQLGEPALIAAACGLPVVSNFRPADMAAGGQGAPLVPLLDYVLFAHPHRARVLQNIGGIGNLTAIPAGPGGQSVADQASVLAFDTGPGNMVVDALMQQLFGKPYDRDGRTAARGRILEPALRAALRHPFFRRQPPKSAGREQFGADYAQQFLADCRRHSSASEDAVATATALTVESIALAIRRWVLPHVGDAPLDCIVSGGGARNRTILEGLRLRLQPFNGTVGASDGAGIPAEAKEAVAFALLAYQTWNLLPGNVPSATGAARPAILGSVTYAPQGSVTSGKP